MMVASSFMRAIKRGGLPLALFAALAVLYISVSVILPKVALTPEENIREHYFSLIAEQGPKGLAYEEPANAEYHTELIKPRNAVVGSHGRIAPSDFLGIYTYLFPIIFFFTKINQTAVAFSVFSLIGLFGVFRIAGSLFNRQTALIAVLLAGTFPAYLYWQGRFMTDIPSLACMLLGMSFYIDAFKMPYLRDEVIKPSRKLLLAAALFIAIGITVKYTNALLAVFFFATFLPYKKLLTDRSIFWSHVLMGVVAFVVLLPILLLNAKLYGGPLVTGQSLYSGSDTILRTTDVDLFSSFKKYFISFFGATSVLAFFSIIYKYKTGDGMKVRFAVFSVAYSGLTFLYFSKAADVYGAQAQDVLLSYSQVRYFLPIFLLLIMMSSYFFWSARQSHMTSNVIVGLLCVVFIFNAANYKSVGLQQSYTEGQRLTRQRDFILGHTPPDAYVFTSLSDKILFPERKIVTYYNAGQDGLDVRIANTVKLASAMREDRKPVYFMWESVDPAVATERGYGKFSDYNDVFSHHNLSLTYIGQDLYKVGDK